MDLTTFPLPALFGLPPITLVLGLVAAASLPGLIIGLVRFRHTDGKLLTIASALVLLALLLIAAAVLFTVWSGSMG